MQEAAFYNALNVSEGGVYRKLRDLRANHDSWEECWRQRGASEVDVEKEWTALGAHGVGLVLREDEAYPPLLREIPHPPFGLYYKGRLTAATESMVVAVVGTRRASDTGKALAREFGSALARAGCAVASGLAFGIDAAAHTGALEGGVTVAVLANGLDRVYPSSHQRLAEHIIESGGVLLSEYPLGSVTFQARFLERNRIVSGLAHAVLAIEAPERSGVIATARFAMEQNRDLYVVPGPVNHRNYKGSHRLIRAGATLVTSPAEMLADLGIESAADGKSAGAETPEEESVLAAIRDAGRALTIDEIIEAATLTSSIVNRSLTMLVLKNAVRESSGRYEPCN